MIKKAVAVMLLSACGVERAGEALAPAESPLPVLTWGFEPASPDCNGWAV